MTDAQRRSAAKQFAADWAGKGYEKGQSQTFWLALLQKVYGVAEPDKFIVFEDQIMLDHTSFIDGFIPATHVLIEQKGLGKDLNKPIKQSDGTSLTPFQQAKRYAAELPYSQRPRWIVTCNFAEFHVYDMERPTGEAEVIKLADLEKEYYRLQFLVDTGDSNIRRETEVSLKAGELVGVLYDALLKQYKDPESPETLKSLNALCVRLVFCLYAEDAGIFGPHGLFHNYLQQHIHDARRALIDLFKVLDTKEDDRDPYMDNDLAAFPYVNGGLFADESLVIPKLDANIVDLIVNRASADFDWSAISPTIFGAVFESTLNPETRRSGGMHYTSIENIHKVIDPLFLDDLRAELAAIKEIKAFNALSQRLKAFQDVLKSKIFLDPACGSGNFLTETYISLRRLENEVIALRIAAEKGAVEGQIALGTDSTVNPIQVSISQFYGIEINDFAVTVAKTALWIAESQMMKETEDIVHMSLDFLPLKSYANIVEGNALRLDWESVVPKRELDYIMGNPPFVGARLMEKEQKDDLSVVFSGLKNVGNLDYVSGWYKKAAALMNGSSIRAALVSTNSITQGEQVPILWKSLIDDGVHIDFAHRTFRWDSEAKIKAHVHCVIIGFSIAPCTKAKQLFTSERATFVENINPYLVDGPTVLIDSRKRTLCDVPNVVFGSMPNDGGHLSDYSAEEKNAIVAEHPEASVMFKRFLGATEFLHNKERWCLWLKGISPSQLRKVPKVLEAVSAVKEMRESSNREATKKLAQTPTLFGEIRQPEAEYIIIPRHSSQNRRYIPIGFVSPEIICGDANLLMPDASLFHFGVMLSNVHNAWMRTVCGRIKSDYRYSVNVVYNNFPWPTPTDAQKAKIEQTAQAILDARALYPEASLADLYDEVAMPPELRKAHQQNDKAVMQAYGFDVKTTTESSCVAELMKLYQKLTEQ
ncbi:MAG: class I SAM-dependent DNA methyltransferase [Ruminococcaceae bacterium]|nr:class I SAM-dependent DNA methyltransferase [Oscillospiraceae bacterium]